MKTLKEKIEIMQAALDGKKVQFNDGDGLWCVNFGNVWNWEKYDYRIKPEPMEFYINIHPDGRKHVFCSHSFARAGNSDAVKTIKVREVIDDE